MASKVTSTLNLPDLSILGQPTQQVAPNSTDYVQDINVVSQLKDPRFLRIYALTIKTEAKEFGISQAR